MLNYTYDCSGEYDRDRNTAINLGQCKQIYCVDDSLKIVTTVGYTGS